MFPDTSKMLRLHNTIIRGVKNIYTLLRDVDQKECTAYGNISLRNLNRIHFRKIQKETDIS